MRKSILVLFLIVLIFSMAGYILPDAFRKAGAKNQKIILDGRMNRKPERIGERIVYDVQFGKLTLGKAIFSCLSKTQFKGREAKLITFETRLARFTDKEKIYSEAETFLPLRVERFVSTWPFPENITEDYDQEKFVLTIRKAKAGKEESIIIRKGNVINNAVLLPYFVRDMEDLKVGYNMVARLPNQEFLIKLVSEEEVVVPAGKFRAYRFTSEPKKFEIWISADERRIPLKIKGVNGLGYTLVMKEYSL